MLFYVKDIVKGEIHKVLLKSGTTHRYLQLFLISENNNLKANLMKCFPQKFFILLLKRLKVQKHCTPYYHYNLNLLKILKNYFVSYIMHFLQNHGLHS